MKKTFLTSLLAVALAFTLQAGTTRVSSYREFKSVVNTLQSGDTVLFASGVYKDIVLKFNAKGTEEKPIVLRAEIPGGTILTGRSRIDFSADARWLVVEGFRFDLPERSAFNRVTFGDRTSHCRISDCLFSDGTEGEFKERSTYTVGLNGRYHTVSHCTFLDKKSLGVQVSVKVDTTAPVCHVIEDNYFERPTVLRGPNGGPMNAQECIRIGYSGHSLYDCGCVVRRNWFNRCRGELNEIISNKSCANVYEGNLFTSSPGTLTLRHGNRCIVRGNVFLGGDCEIAGGVRVIGEDHLVEGNWFEGLGGTSHRSAFSIVRGKDGAPLGSYLPSDNCTVRGNVFVNCRQALLLGIRGYMMEGDRFPKGLSICGNTVVSVSSGQVAVELLGPDSVPFEWKGNKIFNGRQAGTSFKTLNRKPKMTDALKQSVIKVKDTAGITWK